MNKLIVSNEYSGNRLDKYLSNVLTDYSRTHISKLIDDENVLVNGKVAKSSLKVKENDEVIINIPEVKDLEVNKEDIPLDIVYEDNDILIINKPQGVFVMSVRRMNDHSLRFIDD